MWKTSASACWSRECVPGQLVRDPPLAATTQRNPQLCCCFGSSSSEEMDFFCIGYEYYYFKLLSWLWSPYHVGSNHVSSIPNLFLASGFSKKSQIGSCCLHYTLLLLLKLLSVYNINSHNLYIVYLFECHKATQLKEVPEKTQKFRKWALCAAQDVFSCNSL